MIAQPCIPAGGVEEEEGVEGEGRRGHTNDHLTKHHTKCKITWIVGQISTRHLIKIKNAFPAQYECS